MKPPLTTWMCPFCKNDVIHSRKDIAVPEIQRIVGNHYLDCPSIDVFARKSFINWTLANNLRRVSQHIPSGLEGK